jgi:hypothetical protein
MEQQPVTQKEIQSRIVWARDFNRDMANAYPNAFYRSSNWGTPLTTIERKVRKLHRLLIKEISVLREIVGGMGQREKWLDDSLSAEAQMLMKKEKPLYEAIRADYAQIVAGKQLT